MHRSFTTVTVALLLIAAAAAAAGASYNVDAINVRPPPPPPLAPPPPPPPLAPLAPPMPPVEDNRVVTPFGKMRPECVHNVPAKNFHVRRDVSARKLHVKLSETGEQLHFDMCDDSNHNVAPVRDEDDGWNTYLSWYTPSPLSIPTHFYSKFVVPDDAVTETNQVLFFFPGEQNMQTVNSEIVQPVLQWGTGSAAQGSGKFWAVASWYVSSSNVIVSDLEQVDNGEEIEGVMEAIAGGLAWYVGTEVHGVTTSITVDQPLANDWLTFSFEAYSLTSCSQMPASNSIVFTDIMVVLDGDEITIDNWQVHTPYTDCGEGASYASDGSSATLSWDSTL